MCSLNVLMMFALCCGLLKPQDQPTSYTNGQYTILYTGRTLGYARSPESESYQSGASNPNVVAQEYQDLFSDLSNLAKGPVLRLGMGDNFAPDLFARTFQENLPPRTMKDRYVFSGHDNVAQFFQEARYNALIPGKHDFYFGAKRLQEIARLLASKGVQMLGANLSVVTQVFNANPRIPERLDSHPYLADFGAVSIDLPDVVLPYKQKFVIKNARQVRPFANAPYLLRPDQLKGHKSSEFHYAYQLEEPQICWENGPDTNSDPDAIALPSANQGNCARLVVVETACSVPAANAGRQSLCKALIPPDGNTDASADATYVFENHSVRLKAGLNHVFCAKVKDRATPAKPWTCQPFTVNTPFYEYAPQPGDTNPQSYAQATVSGTTVAAFGVVDQDLLANIGQLNGDWRNQNHSLDTAVIVSSAEYALDQLLDECNTHDSCRTARKVLMAQMGYAKAAQLISHVGKTFDVVIAQAEPTHFTPQRVLEDSGPSDSFYPQILLTPPAPYDLASVPKSDIRAQKPFTPVVSRAIVSLSVPNAPSSTLSSSWKLDHKLLQGAPYAADGACHTSHCITLRQLSAAAIEDHSMDSVKGLTSQTALNPPPYAGLDQAASDPVRDLALFAMRKLQRTDLAILQKRDLFDADFLSSQPVSSEDIQDQLNRLFWKGDFVITIYVTGAQLKSLIKQSKKFDELDHDALTTEVEKGRAMQILGVYNDPKDHNTYYVNGAKVDDTTLYTAATTNFLGPGDTGYTDLATPAVPPPMRLQDRDFSHLRSISGIICHQIGESMPFSIPCDDDALGDWYLDQAFDQPADKTPGFNTAAHYRTFFKRFLKPPVPYNDAVEGSAQQRHFLSLTLENADFNYSATLLRRFSTLATTFAGVSAPGVTLKGNKNYGEDYSLRAVYDYRVGTVFVHADSSFQRTFTTGSFIPSTPSNMWGIEGGGTSRMLWWKRPAWLAFQYAGRFEGQLFQPDTASISLPAPSQLAQPQPLLLVPPKTSSVFGRFGLRAEFADTYVEGGFEEIDSRNVLSYYNPVDSIFCVPSAKDQFDCGSSPTLPSTAIAKLPPSEINQLAGLTVRPAKTEDFLTRGLYLNFNIKFPVWSRFSPTGADQSWYFVVTNKGDFYFNHPSTDTNVQTRYLDKLTPSLNFPILGNFAISPKVDIVFYENKIDHSRYRAVEPMISLSYAFKWREGMNFYRALRYGAITQQPTAGASH